MARKVEVGDTAIPIRNYGSCLTQGLAYTVVTVKDSVLGRSFVVDCNNNCVHKPTILLKDSKCVTGWWPIESDFKIIPGVRIRPEEIKNAKSLPSADDAADFFRRKE